MGYLTNEKLSTKLFIACLFAYIAISLGRNSFTSSIVMIIDEGLLDKSAAGLISALFYVFYGVGQVGFGVLGDKVSPFKLVFAGLFFTTVFNLLMFFTSSFAQILALWCLNGIAQATIWPSVLKVTSGILMKEHRRKATHIIMSALGLGSIFSLVISIIILKYSTWRVIFLLTVLILVIASVYWVFITLSASKHLVFGDDAPKEGAGARGEKPVSTKDFKNTIYTSGILLVIVPVISRTVIETGIRNWVPTMIKETYNVSASYSTFLTLLLSIGSLFGIILGVKLFNRLKNEFICANVFYVITIPCVLALFFMARINILTSTLMLGIALTAMASVSQMFGVIMPVRFAEMGRVSTIGGILNAVATVGCIIATYGLGYISQRFGWNYIIMFWMLLAVVSFITGLLATRPWHKFINNKESV